MRSLGFGTLGACRLYAVVGRIINVCVRFGLGFCLKLYFILACKL